MHWLAEHAPKSGKYRFTKFGQLTGRDPREEAKTISELLFLTRRPVLRKKQRALWKEEKKRKRFIFDFGSTGWQSTPQNLVNIDSPNLVD